MVIRDGCTIFQSPVQQHDFNFTYQLECSSHSDLPSSGQVLIIILSGMLFFHMYIPFVQL